AGQTDVTIDGQFTYPNTSVRTLAAGLTADWGDLIRITGKYIVWDGIDIKRSKGNGLAIRGTAEEVTVQNSSIYNSYVSCMPIQIDGGNRPSNITVDSCTIYESGMFLPSLSRGGADWPGCVSIKGADNVTISSSTIHTTWGEGIMADTKGFQSTGITIEDNVIYDNFSAPIYIHAASDIVVQRNFVYQSTTNQALSYPYGPMPVQGGIIVTPAEAWIGVVNTEDVKVVSNIASNFNTAPGISIRSNNTARGAINDLLIANNTVANCHTGLLLNIINKSGLVLKNNIITECTTAFVEATDDDADWTCDYNYWDTEPSYFEGANDVYGDVGGPVDLVDANASFAAGEGDPTKFGLDSASTAAAAGVDLTAAYATAPAADTADYWGESRAAWDIGAHEDSGVYAPTITVVPTPDPATIVEGELVDFNSTVVGGTGPFAYAWTFPGGSPSTSTDADPQNVSYATAGIYTAKGIVTDTATNITDEVTETITVKTTTSTVTSPVNVEQVIFDAGDASYAVTEAPVAILFMWGGGVADGTAKADSKLGFGIYDVANNQGYGMGMFADDGAATSNTAVGIKDGYPIFAVGIEESELFTGAISSVTASAVNLSWAGTTASEKIISWNFYGSGITNVLATSQYMGASNVNNTLSGDYTHVFMPAVMRPVGSIYGNVDCSIGIGIKDGGQMCLAYGQSDGKATTETFNKIYTDKVAGYARSSPASIEITSFTSTSVVFTPRSRDILTDVPLLAMNISGADSYLAVEDTPVTAALTNYNDAGFGSGVMMGLMSNLTAVDTQNTDSAVAGILTVDSANVDRTVIISSKDAVGTSVEKAYTDSDYAMLDEDGAIASEGAAAMTGNGFSITPTTADSTARKFISFLIEGSSVSGGGPTADFTWTTEDPVYTDTIQFSDLSIWDGVNVIDEWDWDWGDGTAHGTTENPTHSYDSAGTYEVILEVTDDDDDTDTKQRAIGVGVPASTVSFTVSPTSGQVPLTVTLDASGSTAGGDELLDEDETTWIIASDDHGWFHVGDVEIETGYQYFTNGITVDIILDPIATWHVICKIKQASTSNEYVQVEWNAIETTQELITNFDSQHGKTAVAGEYTADFEATVNMPNLEGIYYEWDFGDGNTDDGYDKAEVSNVYAAQSSKSVYDVTLDITLPGGAADTLTKSDYITIVPVPVAPLNLDALTAIAAEVKKHIGCLADATWVVDGSYSNVYTATVSRKWASGYTYMTKEDGADLTEKASIELCNGTAGSYYVHYNDPNLEVSVHATGSDDPTTNGSIYSLRFT
ncbi:hypothetical protein DRQ25_13305, partial [Candidatus Fermentibacteria bacterium]